MCLQIRCLEELTQDVEVANISPIPASIRCWVRSKHGYFTVQNPEFTLERGSSRVIRVVAAFVEAVAATGQLIISAVDGQDTLVTLKGQVNPMDSCKSYLQVVPAAVNAH